MRACNLGAAWQANEHWLMFGEVLATGHDRTAGNAGVRCWLVPGTVGLDFSAGLSAAGRTTLSPGLGWYRVRLP